MTGFEQLERQLLGSVRELERAEQPAREVKGRRRRLRWPSRPVALVLAGLVISGTAAAAVATLSASRSQPLAGRVPGLIEPASLAGDRYRITIAPDLTAGDAGWATAVLYWNGHGPVTGMGSSGGDYASRTNPIFAGSIGGFGLGAQTHGKQVEFVITAPEVAAVRVGSQTIQTFTSADLPAGDRAAVFFEPQRPLILTNGWRPGTPLRSYQANTGLPERVLQLALVPLDRSGRPIPADFAPTYTSDTAFWQARSAVTPNIHEPPYHGPTHPGRGVCALGQKGLPGLTPEWGHTVTRLSPVRDAEGELFLSCVNTQYYLHGWPVDVAILLNARNPGAVPGAIPGAKPVPFYRDTVDLEAAGLTARRIGGAWVAVEGGSGLTQRLRVLAALRIARLDLAAIRR